ncbi:MAG TPA: GNAT family N-acetyltransferase [Dehalococcoidales bacterium]
MPDWVISNFRIEDYDRLTTLWKESGLSYRPRGRDSRRRIEAELKTGTSIFLVDEMDGQMVGSVIGTHDGRKGWINRLAVHPSYRHRGLAKKLVAEVEDRLSQVGLEVIAGLIEQSNTASLQLFQSLGYERMSDIVYLSKRKRPEA